MKIIQLCSLLLVAGMASACAQIENYNATMKDWWSGDTARQEKERLAQSARYRTMSTAEIMSNESVIVYPVDGGTEDEQKGFPEDVSDTGYTVFDPSVQVYSVDGSAEARPSYLPDYAVPLYSSSSSERPDITFTTPDIAKDMGGVTATPLTPINEDYHEPLSKVPGRRSAPVLTGY